MVRRMLNLRGWFQRWRASKHVHVFTDGSAHERPGLPGGWAFALVQSNEVIATGSGAEKITNNHGMELRAAVEGLREVVARGLHRRASVELVSDSRVTIDIVNGARPSQAHLAEALELQVLCLTANVRGRWVRGHSGVTFNELVDTLAHDAKQMLVPARKRKNLNLSASGGGA